MRIQNTNKFRDTNMLYQFMWKKNCSTINVMLNNLTNLLRSFLANIWTEYYRIGQVHGH